MPAVVLKDTGTHQEQDAEWFKQRWSVSAFFYQHHTT